METVYTWTECSLIIHSILKAQNIGVVSITASQNRSEYSRQYPARNNNTRNYLTIETYHNVYWERTKTAREYHITNSVKVSGALLVLLNILHPFPSFVNSKTDLPVRRCQNKPHYPRSPPSYMIAVLVSPSLLHWTFPLNCFGYFLLIIHTSCVVFMCLLYLLPPHSLHSFSLRTLVFSIMLSHPLFPPLMSSSLSLTALLFSLRTYLCVLPAHPLFFYFSTEPYTASLFFLRTYICLLPLHPLFLFSNTEPYTTVLLAFHFSFFLKLQKH